MSFCDDKNCQVSGYCNPRGGRGSGAGLDNQHIATGLSGAGRSWHFPDRLVIQLHCMFTGNGMLGNNTLRNDRRAKGFSLIELLIVVAIILIIAAIAVPNMLRARISANEASAVSSVRTISRAEVTYFSAYQPTDTLLHWARWEVQLRLASPPTPRRALSMPAWPAARRAAISLQPLDCCQPAA